MIKPGLALPSSLTLPFGASRHRTILALGDEARDRCDWIAASEYYRLYLDAKPHDFAIWVQFGHALKESGKRVEALIAYSEALNLDVSDADLLLSLGHLHKLMGHRDEAVSFYLMSAEADGNVHALGELNRLGINENLPTGLPSEAHQQKSPERTGFSGLLTGLAAGPARWADRIKKRSRIQGDLARDRRDWPAAAEHYRTHLRRQPKDFAIWIQLGHALKETGRLDDALSAYGQAQRLDAEDANLLLSLGHLYKLMGRPEDAISYYRSSAARDGNAHALDELGRMQAGPAARHAEPADSTGLARLNPIEEQRIRTINDIELRLRARKPSCVIEGPLISILAPAYNVDEVWLTRMIESVQRQTYTRWQLCLVDDGSSQGHVWEAMSRIAANDPRISIARRPENGGISAASNDALAMAKGSYVALLDNDDMLTCDALEEMVRAIKENDSPDWLYSDEFKIDQDDRASALFAKPDWSPLLMLNYMYTGHFTLYNADLVRRVGGFRSQFDFSQDYDLALRVAEYTSRVHHVDKYLYGWRMIEGSSSQGGKPEARLTNIAALQDAAERRGWGGHAVPLPTANRLERPGAGQGSLFSIVVPSDNRSNIETTIRSICETSTYPKFEIVVVTNSRIIGSLKPAFDGFPVVWAAYDKPFNFSDKCNVGAAICKGDHIAFFNDDVRVVTPDWIEVLLEYLTLPGVGVVGPKLLYEDGNIQHAGMVSGVRRLVGTAFHAYPGDTSVHFNMAQCVREVSLICGALLAMPRSVFEQVGGFDAENAPISHSDVDLCFRVRETGLSCVYTPHATLVHVGHMSLAETDAAESKQKVYRKNKADTYLLRRFGAMIERDPYFPPAMRDLIYIDSQEYFHCYASTQSASTQDVVLISHDLTGSGAPKVVYDVALALKRAGRFVVVVSPSDGRYRQMLQAADITVIIDPLILTAHEASMDLVKNFDLVIANTIVTWRAVEALRKYTTVYWYTHETELVTHFATVYPEFAELIRSDVTIWSGSERSAEAIRRYGNIPQVLEYGADDIALAGASRPVTIAVFGSFEPRKGQDLAVLGMGLIPAEVRSQAKLVLYGRVLDREFHAQVVSMARSFDEIEIGGELSYRRYREELMSADIILVSSRDDTLPLVSLDALALGKALVCTAATGTSAYLEHGVSALILPHGAPGEIASQLEILISDAQLRQRMGREGREVFNKWFTQKAFEDRLMNALAPAPAREAVSQNVSS